VNIALSAWLAITAEDNRINSRPVAYLDISDAFADFGDLAGEFMAHDHGRSSSAGDAEIAMNIGAADAAGFDAEKHFSGKGLEIGDILLPQILRPIVHKSFHRVSPPPAYNSDGSNRAPRASSIPV
jgi:hypothetical protein